MTFREWLIFEKTKLSATGLNAGGRASGDKGMYTPAKGMINPAIIKRKKIGIRSL